MDEAAQGGAGHADAGLVRIKRALISVSDKTGLEPLVRALAKFDVEIISTGGTAKAIEAMGVPVTPVEAVTGFPEILGGRVKTLHPAIHAAILADRDNPEHMAELEAHGITPIDLVVVNLYPFEETAKKEGVTEEELIEQIDIGGVALLRAAAKNAKHVCVLTHPQQYETLENATSMSLTTADRANMSGRAFRETAGYDAIITTRIHHQEEYISRELRYGENPHQRAQVIAGRQAPPKGPAVIPGVGATRQLAGKELSYNNLADASAATLLAWEFGCELFPEQDEPWEGATAAVCVKHTNPCGAATSLSTQDAARAAMAGDPRAAYGGVFAVTGTVDIETARLLVESSFLEVVIAPKFANGAAELITERWKSARLIETGELRTPEPHMRKWWPGDQIVREILGGTLNQTLDTAWPRTGEWVRNSGVSLNHQTTRASSHIWLCAKHLTSNAIAIGGPDPDDGADPSTVRLFGAGCGQQDRVWACRIAAEKAKDSIERARAKDLPVIGASDAFFPFPDGPELLIDAGVTVIVHPGGSKRDHETFELCERHGVTCLTTGVRHFRH
ncbi:MAG: bifunctional phosphoribosylaminoimidazolecarboxamide formyltransferase/IMP cyclohydrolase [Planctomycetota bacterium]